MPFYKQTLEDNCGPASLKMVLDYLGETLNNQELEKLIGFKKGAGVFTVQIAIAAAELGYKVEIYSKSVSSLRTDLESQESYTDLIDYEISLLRKARDSKVILYKRELSLKELLSLVNKDNAMIVLLNWNVMLGKDGYLGHFVPLVGYDRDNVFIHDPNPEGSKFKKIPKRIFDKARKSEGTDEDILVISKKKKNLHYLRNNF